MGFSRVTLKGPLLVPCTVVCRHISWASLVCIIDVSWVRVCVCVCFLVCNPIFLTCFFADTQAVFCTDYPERKKTISFRSHIHMFCVEVVVVIFITGLSRCLEIYVFYLFVVSAGFHVIAGCRARVICVGRCLWETRLTALPAQFLSWHW